MKVTVITGSPHKKGTSAPLADEFIRGAQEALLDTCAVYAVEGQRYGTGGRLRGQTGY